jgi:hypothetical protein
VSYQSLDCGRPPRQARTARSPSSLDVCRRAPRGVLICHAPAAHPPSDPTGWRARLLGPCPPALDRPVQTLTLVIPPATPRPARIPVSGGRAAAHHNRRASTGILKTGFSTDASPLSLPRFDQVRRVPEPGKRRLGPDRVGPSKSVSRPSRPVPARAVRFPSSASGTSRRRTGELGPSGDLRRSPTVPWRVRWNSKNRFLDRCHFTARRRVSRWRGQLLDPATPGCTTPNDAPASRRNGAAPGR